MYRSLSEDGSRSGEDAGRSLDELLHGLEAGEAAAAEQLAVLDRRERESLLESAAGLHATMRAVEALAGDDAATGSLAALLLGYLQDGKTSVRTRRARRFVQADVLSSLQRALIARLSTAISPATDALVDLFVVVANKDPKTQFKVRVGGLLQALCQMIIDNRSPLSERLLRLLARSVRSPRNAQLAGRKRDLSKALMQRSADSRHSSAMARHLEVLYLIAKNKKTRGLMLSNGAAGRLVGMLDRLAPTLEDADSPAEATLLIVGLLKLFANSRRGKEEVLSAGMVSACEKCLDALETAVDKRGDKTAATQLQDALCSLCVRCVPAEKFPLAGQSSPLSFTLPRTRTRTLSSKGGEKRATTSYARAEDGGRSSGKRRERRLGHGRRCARAEGRRNTSDMPQLSKYAKFFAELEHGAISKDRTAKKKSIGGSAAPTVSTQPQPIQYAQAILNQTQSTRSIQRWVKVAYPELVGPDRELPLQPLVFSTNAMRLVASKASKKGLEKGKDAFKSRIVYSLDACAEGRDGGAQENGRLGNEDKMRLGKLDARCDHLLFESRFESGNLRAAIQTDKTHYELILQPEANQARDHFQWFYFEISNCDANVEYTFEIVNCLKTSSMFVHGMQPVAFSVGEAAAGRPGWVRVGHSICYYRNQYVIDADVAGHRKDRFFSLRFTFALRHKGDVCYLAYHFPYTYSMLRASLECWTARSSSSIYVRRDEIGQSLAGNPLPLVTITGAGSSAEEVAGRDTVVFSARVHPGETNASWIMQGILEYLLTCDDAIAREARERLVFKCIPMLNPDGVLAGNHRCSLAGHDLNRVWDSPSRSLHPEIFHAKAIVQAACETRRPLLFIDLHGHSRRSNCFLYGNNPDQSWRAADVVSSPTFEFVDTAEIMEVVAPAFSARNCRWSIARSKEGSARVALWRQLGLQRAYTMECTYAGFESGPYKGYQIGISELKEIGRNLVHTALTLSKRDEDTRSRVIDR
uniref:Peptidase M14 domain-containing protein n=1 Tax=Pristionchus pacificus TaxID=54126 RepID=A0A8R1V5M9_PRIPA